MKNYKSKIKYYIFYDSILKFGKYRGKEFKWVTMNDPSYAKWCINTLKDTRFHYRYSPSYGVVIDTTWKDVSYMFLIRWGQGVNIKFQKDIYIDF